MKIIKMENSKQKLAAYFKTLSADNISTEENINNFLEVLINVLFESDKSSITFDKDGNLVIKNGKKILLEKKDGSYANGISVGDYGSYEQVEIGTESDPLCLNHSAKAPNGTIIGKNIIVNYKDESGVNKTDAVAYISE